MASTPSAARKVRSASAIRPGCMCKIGLLACSAAGETISVRLQVENNTAASIGWQLFDPESNRLLSEGEWIPLPADARQPVDLNIGFPLGPGGYRVYVSAIDP